MNLVLNLARYGLLFTVLITFNLKLGDAKSSYFDGGIVNLLKVKLERLLQKILRYTQAQEVRELERMKQLLFYYYRYNKTTNVSEVHHVTPLEDFEVFTGTPSEFSITEIANHLKRNAKREFMYKNDWRRIRRKNFSKENAAYLANAVRKLPHVNKTLVRLVFDEIDGNVTVPTHRFYELFPTRTWKRRVLKFTQPKHYLRYVSFRKLTKRPRNATTAHMCELC